MKLTEDEVRYVADLANLRLTEEEVHRMSHDLGEILTHIEQLNELDTSQVEPMAQVLFPADETATLREDVPHHCLGNQAALANAPMSGAGYFKVPKVIERHSVFPRFPHSVFPRFAKRFLVRLCRRESWRKRRSPLRRSTIRKPTHT